MKTWVTRDLAQYAVNTKFDDYPERIIECAKMLILDNLGCMIGGCYTNLGKAMLNPIKTMGGSPEATIIGGSVKVPTIQAALVNGTTANALDFDETLEGVGHPGSTIIPAALAIGEWKKVLGRDLINAVLIGYDVGNRIGRAIQPTYERLQKVWCVGTWQTFGAVAAASKLLDLDLEGTLNAYGVAGATAPLPNTQKWGWDLSERPIHWVKEPTGWPSWTGTMAAVLAANGFIGNRYILDGHNGFWIMAGSDRCDWEKMTKGLGSDFEVETISIKPYSSCRWQHAALDGVSHLKQAHHLTTDNVEAINIHTFEWVCTHEVYGPKDMVDAQFSMPYTATMVMFGYSPGPEWYTEDNLKDEKVLNFSKRVKVKLDKQLNYNYFNKDEISAKVEIISTSGEVFETLVEIPSGDPRNPMSREDIKQKFAQLASCALTTDSIEKIMEKVENLEKITDITEVMELLCGNYGCKNK